jgi:bacterioferritin-associated ferredoxin
LYACICHQITEKELEETFSEANGNVSETLRKLNLGQGCGICLIDAMEKVGMQIASKETKIAKKN